MPYILDASTSEPGVPLSELLTEFYKRGHDYLNDGGDGTARAKRWLNQAHSKVVLEELWPFRLTTTAGTAPLTISRLDKIYSVTDTTNDGYELHEVNESELVGYLTMTGTPFRYYRDNLIVRVWPVAAHVIEVRYYSVPFDLSLDTDVTMVPKRYMDVIIDDAARRAAKDRQYAEGVQLAAQEYNDGLDLMRRQLLVSPSYVPYPYGNLDD